MFSGLIYHATVNGEKIITSGMFVGAVLNSTIFILLRSRQ